MIVFGCSSSRTISTGMIRTLAAPSRGAARSLQQDRGATVLSFVVGIIPASSPLPGPGDARSHSAIGDPVCCARSSAARLHDAHRRLLEACDELRTRSSSHPECRSSS